jgi:predicted GNAT family acetyltransferase
MSSAVPSVTHNVAAHRFETTVEGHLSVCEYERTGDVITFTHTAVPPELRGRGLAELLVRTALAEARRENLKVVPACSYVATFINRHPEFADLLA